MDENTKVCPFCEESIKADAVKCRFCGEFLTEKNKNSIKISCPFCREDIDENITICPFCDSELKKDSSLKTENRTCQKSFAGKKNIIIEKFKNVSRRNLLITAGIFAVVFCGILIFSISGTKKKKEEQTEVVDYVEDIELAFGEVEDVDLPPGRPDYQLLEYTELGDLRAVKYLVLKLKANVNGAYYTDSGESALHVALRKNFNDIAKFLIRKGADVNYLAKGTSVFIYPLSRNDQKMMSLLLKHNAEKILGAVLFAVQENNADLLKYLLERGFDPNVWYKDTEDTALHLAVENNFSEGVRLLLRHKANVHEVNKKGESVLHKWLKSGDPEIFKMLRNAKISLDHADSNGNTPLMVLVSTTNIENEKAFPMIRMLVEAGASVTVRDKNGFPLLSKTNAPNVLEYLLSLNAPILKHQDDLRLLNLNYKRNNFSDKDLARIVEMLFRSGADPNSESRYRSEYDDILAFAVRNLYPETLKVLLKYGIKKRTGLYTILLSNQYFQRNPTKAKKYARFLDVLIECGMPVSANDFNTVNAKLPGLIVKLLESKCPLHEQVWFDVIDSSQAEELAPLLLKRKLNLNIKNNYKETPLLLSIRKNPKIAKLLINNGADINYYVTETPLEIAVRENNPEIIAMLLEHGAKANSLLLKEALNGKKYAIAKILLENGADPYENNAIFSLFNDQNLTDEECLSVARILAKHKTDFSLVCPNRFCWIKSSQSWFSGTMNFFDMAALCGYVKTIEFIKNKTSPKKDPSSLSLVRLCEDPEVKEFLLKNKIGGKSTTDDTLKSWVTEEK